MSPDPLINDPQTFDAIVWGITVVAAPVSGLLGVLLGGWLTSRREKDKTRLDFRRQQLSEFYSPLLGIRKEIRARSELRVRVQSAASNVWREMCADTRGMTPDARREMTDRQKPKFDALINYDNAQLEEKLLPFYRKMVDMFRDKFWLAEPETQAHFSSLIEFVDLWDRWIGGSIPPEVITALGHGEESLRPLYEHLQARHDELQSKLIQGKP